jgi:catechol 2,3-dioxygenase-like lactoylglutathione lyase family enzyme
MPGSRHFEDRGKHLGANRVAQVLMGAATIARDAAAMRSFYLEKLGFAEIAAGSPVRLRIPGDSGQELEIAGEGTGGMQFGVPDLARAAEMLNVLGMQSARGQAWLKVRDPDGVSIAIGKRD